MTGGALDEANREPSDGSSIAERPSRRPETAEIVALVVLAVATRWVFRTRLAYSWDVANFILATRQFNLKLHLPHPLGYVVWVAMGRLGVTLGAEPHTAFLAWNVLATALGTALIYRLGRDLWGRSAALAAGALFVTSPVTWFYGGTGYADIWDATLGMAIALLAWQQRGNPGLWRAVLATLVYSLAAGIRQQNLLFLFPLWALALRPHSWRIRAEMAAMLVALSAAWAIPLVNGAGGLAGYLMVSREHTHSGLWGYAWSDGHGLWRTGRAAIYVLDGLVLAVPGALLILPLYLFLSRRGRGWGLRWRDSRTQLLLLWAFPSLLFLLVVHLDVRPGLMLGMLPPLLLATAAACASLRTPRGFPFSEHTGAKMLALLVAVNLIFFLTADLPTSRIEMMRHDGRLETEYQAIRQRFAPDTTLLLSNSSWYWYSARQAAVYLPAYEVWYIGGTDNRRWWASRYGRSWTLPNLVLPTRIRTIVFIHDHRYHADDPRKGAEVDPGLIHRDPLPSGGDVCWMRVGEGDRALIYTPVWHGPRPVSAAPVPAQSSRR